MLIHISDHVKYIYSTEITVRVSFDNVHCCFYPIRSAWYYTAGITAAFSDYIEILKTVATSGFFRRTWIGDEVLLSSRISKFFISLIPAHSIYYVRVFICACYL